MTYRPAILFCDVDRTLLTHAHVLLPEIASSIAKLTNAGVRVILASARSPSSVQYILADLKLDGPTICLNGAWIGDAARGVASRSSTLPQSVAIAIVKHAVEANLVPMWYSSSAVFSLQQFGTVAAQQVAVTHDQLVMHESVDKFPHDPFKLMLVAAPDRLEVECRRLVNAFSKTVSILRSGPGLIEVVHKDVNKAVAAAEIARQLQLPVEVCAAAGDSENDVELLRWAGVAVTVENGVAEARRIAHFTGGHCDTGGLALSIEWLLSLPEGPRPVGQRYSANIRIQDIQIRNRETLPSSGQHCRGETT